MIMGSQTIPSKSDAICDIFALLRPSVYMLAVWAGLALCAMDVAADSIVYRGVLYEDVLIYKGSASYYVKVPDEGRVFNVPIHEVNPSQVGMVHDPYYRDELKLRFEDAKKRLKSGEVLRRRDSGSSFSLADSGNEELSASDLLDSGGGAGLGIPLDTVKALLIASGMTIAKVAGVVTATDTSGTTIKLYGAPDSLSRIDLQVNGYSWQKGKIQANLQLLQGMISTFVPWAGPWLQSNMEFFQKGGRAEETRDGSHIVFGVAIENTTLTVELMLESV